MEYICQSFVQLLLQYGVFFGVEFVWLCWDGDLCFFFDIDGVFLVFVFECWCGGFGVVYWLVVDEILGDYEMVGVWVGVVVVFECDFDGFEGVQVEVCVVDEEWVEGLVYVLLFLV